MDAGVTTGLRYRAGEPVGHGVVHLVANPGTADEQRVPFCNALEIGRDEQRGEALPGLLLVSDPMVSRRHCVITRAANGRWYVRDVSRNGTRLAGRRLVPNVETEIHPGQTLTIGSHDFMLDTRARVEPVERRRGRTTDEAPTCTIATVLVGDIRDYTVLVQRVSSALLQPSVSRVFEILTSAIVERGGTVKEYPGDAVLAFWEGGCDGTQAVAACRAALELDRLAQRIADDPAVWEAPGFPLAMDWALATGVVMIQAFGGQHPQGLSLIGEPVVLASRLEKLAGDETGRILTCGRTRALAAGRFAFRDLGDIAVKGFDRPPRVYALEERLGEATVPTLGLG